MIQAVCFDLDGTLIHFKNDYTAYLRYFAQRLGLQDDLARLLPVYEVERRREDGHNFSDLIARSIAALGLPQPVGLLEFCQEAVVAYADGVELLPNALAMLEYFSHLPLALISNGPADMQRAAIEKVGIAGYFKAIVVSADADVGVRKPNPKIFQIACERLEVEPKNVLMIGDNLEQDIRGAEAFGMQALWVQR